MGVRKWDLVWAGLDPTIEHEQFGRRPVLVFCNDAIASPIRLFTVLPLTTWKAGRRVYPTEVQLPAGTGGLAVDSLVLAHQIRTVSARRLSPPFGALEPAGLRRQVTAALGAWLDFQES